MKLDVISMEQTDFSRPNKFSLLQTIRLRWLRIGFFVALMALGVCAAFYPAEWQLWLSLSAVTLCGAISVMYVRRHFAALRSDLSVRHRVGQNQIADQLAALRSELIARTNSGQCQVEEQLAALRNDLIARDDLGQSQSEEQLEILRSDLINKTDLGLTQFADQLNTLRSELIEASSFNLSQIEERLGALRSEFATKIDLRRNQTEAQLVALRKELVARSDVRQTQLEAQVIALRKDLVTRSDNRQNQLEAQFIASRRDFTTKSALRQNQLEAQFIALRRDITTKSALRQNQLEAQLIALRRDITDKSELGQGQIEAQLVAMRQEFTVKSDLDQNQIEAQIKELRQNMLQTAQVLDTRLSNMAAELWATIAEAEALVGKTAELQSVLGPLSAQTAAAFTEAEAAKKQLIDTAATLAEMHLRLAHTNTAVLTNEAAVADLAESFAVLEAASRVQLQALASQIQVSAAQAREASDASRSATTDAAKALAEIESISHVRSEFREASEKSKAAAADATKALTELRKISGEFRTNLEKFRDNSTDRLQHIENTLQRLGGVNAARARPFTRALSEEVITRFEKHWLRIFGLTISTTQLAYIAHQINRSEDLCEGRIAAAIETSMLRLLAAWSLPPGKRELLEIGTLFGIGAGVLHRLPGPRASGVSLTLIDPLSGYYDVSTVDPPTGVPVSRATLEANFRALQIPAEDWRLIENISTNDEAVAAASDRRYDMVIIDGDHSVDGVARDFELYGPMVKPGGLLLFDDYESRFWPGIKMFVDNHVVNNSAWVWLGGEYQTGIVRRATSAEPALQNG